MINNIITINGKSVERLEYKGQPVITLRMIDELHGRPEGTARKRFNDNKQHFIEGEDFFLVPYDEHRIITAVRITDGGYESEQRNPMYFFTQTGYLMLTKVLTDDLAWEVQRKLINYYFSHNAGPYRTFDIDRVEKIGAKTERILKKMGFTGKELTARINEIILKETGVELPAVFGEPSPKPEQQTLSM